MTSQLLARLNASKTEVKPEVMYSVDGASFQEFALSNLDFKGSVAHKSIGTLVTAINNSQMTIEVAIAQFTSLLAN